MALATQFDDVMFYRQMLDHYNTDLVPLGCKQVLNLLISGGKDLAHYRADEFHDPEQGLVGTSMAFLV